MEFDDIVAGMPDNDDIVAGMPDNIVMPSMKEEWSFGQRLEDGEWWVLMRVIRDDGLVTEFSILPDDAVMIAEMLRGKADELK